MRYLAAILFAFILPLSLAAQNAASLVPRTESGPIRFGVTALPPYAINGGNSAALGMGVDIWRLIVEREGWAYELVRAGPEALQAGSVDLLLPVAANPFLEARADLTLPFHTATIALAVPEGSPLRERVNRALLDVLSFEPGWDVLQRYDQVKD